MPTIAFELTDEMREEIRKQEEWLKHDIGRHDIEKCLMDNDGFDRRKFGKLKCSFCNHKFNPFYYDGLKQGKWDYVWQGDSHKEPESNCEIECPKCKKQLRFTLYVGQ